MVSLMRRLVVVAAVLALAACGGRGIDWPTDEQVEIARTAVCSGLEGDDEVTCSVQFVVGYLDEKSAIDDGAPRSVQERNAAAAASTSDTLGMNAYLRGVKYAEEASTAVR